MLNSDMRQHDTHYKMLLPSYEGGECLESWIAWVNRRGKKAEHLNIEMGKAKFENGGITFQEERSEKTYWMKERGNLKDEQNNRKNSWKVGPERIREKSWES